MSRVPEFWPDDTPTKFYLAVNLGYNLTSLYEEAQQKWPGVDPKWVNITCEEIRTHNLTHDQYDSNDHTNFLIVERMK